MRREPEQVRRASAADSGTVRWARRSLVGVFYGLAAWLVLLPLPLASNTRLPDPAASGDTIQQAWWLALARWEVTSGHLSLLTDKIYVPTGVNVLDNASFPLLGFLATPLTALVGPLAAFDLLIRLAFVLSAAAVYLALRRVGLSGIASLLGGLIYGFSPFMLHEGDVYLFLAFLPLPPLIFLLVYEHVVESAQGRGRPSLARTATRGSLIGVMAAAQFFISAEIAATSALILGVTLLVVAVTRLRHPEMLLTPLKALVELCVPAAVVALVLLAYPTWYLLDGPDHTTSRSGVAKDSMATWTHLVWPLNNGVVARSLPRFHLDTPPSFNGDFCFIGLPLLAVAVAVVITARRRPLVRASAAMTVCAIILALGQRLPGLGSREGILLPWSLLDRLPGLDQVGAARIIVYAMMGVAVLAAVAADEWLPTLLVFLLRRRPSPPAALLAALGVVLLALSVVYVAPTSGPGVAEISPSPASVSAMLRAVPASSVVLAYPFPRFPADEAMVWQADDNMAFSLVAGYSYQNAPAQKAMMKGAVRRSFTEAWNGLHPSARLAAAARQELPLLVKQYQVTTIVVDIQGPATTGTRWQYARAVVAAKYGRPQRRGDFDVWTLKAVAG